MKKKTEQKPFTFDPPPCMEEYGKRFVRLGEAFQDGNTTIRDLMELSWSCGLILRLVITAPNQKPD